MNTKKYWVIIHGENSEFLLGIAEDGTVEYGDGYTPEKVKAVLGKHFTPNPIDKHGPAIEGHEIAVVTSITTEGGD
jgi:hypothetical protein